ncbi:hypothetical protein FDF74_10750 [Clostridium niameyense]|uniref:SH3 domain-containing protein n=1 Tax=Clostridium niameyense TaxID=1622073 RepID=A0A6M0RBP7_9CLOT|nr:hypothetical protein [Clostridium niameyense]NEZ47666.1 hypothetical protein [Clostridium niameyense]
MFGLLFFLILLCGYGYIFYYFSNKLNLQKKQVLLLKQHNESLKNELKYNNPIKNIKIRYINPDANSGTINKYCNIHLYPMENSPTINSLVKGENIYIVDSAEVSNKLWYEITCFYKGVINTKGWIKQDCIDII